ncbi:MAG: AAA family ATPase [Rhizobiales bacterium]|nr:AAA family ATPase [Hyphomicrobiales bacterium]
MPTGTAFFGQSNTTNLSLSSFTTIGGWTFNAGASDYTLTNAQVLGFTGAGIVINGGSATITNNAGGFLGWFTTSTAGRTTNGEIWPDGAPATAVGSVITLAAEDDVEDTVAPRLLTVKANMQRVFTIRAVRNEDQSRRTFNLGADLARLEAEITRLGDVRLVIIDSISSYLGKVDSHKNAEVRSVLEPLAEMAARLRVAIVCNNHFSKGGGSANNRIIGSVAFVS